jgi:UDP-glucose 4-epimerase
MKCLVTGGSGFIGSHLVDALLSLGHTVVVLDDFSLGKEANLSHHANNKNLITFRKSICEPLDALFEEQQFDVVFHLAALPRVQFSIDYPDKTHAINIDGTFALLLACKKYHVKRFVYSSSSSIYGTQEKLPLTEDMKPNPLSPYALQKFAGEWYCRLFSHLYGIETISLRYFNVYGSRQNPNGAYAGLIPRFIAMVQQGQSHPIYGDGEQTRDFTFVSDVVAANILGATTTEKRCFGETFNIGAGNNISVNNVTSMLISLSKKEITPQYFPARIEAKDTLANISKAKNLLQWTPRVSFEEGLSKTYASFTQTE